MANFSNCIITEMTEKYSTLYVLTGENTKQFGTANKASVGSIDLK